MADKVSKPSVGKKLLRDQRVLLAIVIAIIIVVISVINPNFISLGNIVAIFQQICVLGILTMAMSILLISGGIDLSIGNIMVVCGVVMYVVLNNGMPVAVAVLAGLITGMACGLLNGAIIAKSKCIPLVITLGTSKMFYGIALTVSGGRIMNFGGAFNGLKTKVLEVFSPMLLVLLVMVLLAYVMMSYTKFGRRVVALGGNEKNAFCPASTSPAIKWRCTPSPACSAQWPALCSWPVSTPSPPTPAPTTRPTPWLRPSSAASPSTAAKAPLAAPSWAAC